MIVDTSIELINGTLTVRCTCGVMLMFATRTAGHGEHERIQCGVCGYVILVQVYVTGQRAGTEHDRMVQP